MDPGKVSNGFQPEPGPHQDIMVLPENPAFLPALPAIGMTLQKALSRWQPHPSGPEEDQCSNRLVADTSQHPAFLSPPATSLRGSSHSSLASRLPIGSGPKLLNPVKGTVVI